jgi:Skp family chaperone for outer membrane proteins
MIKPLIAAVAAVLVLAPAALAADPGSSLTADIQKLTSDRASMHSTVIADIQKLTADAQAGSADKSSLKSTIQADIKKLTADLQSGHQTMQADRAQAQADLEAARAAGVKLGA